MSTCFGNKTKQGLTYLEHHRLSP